MSPQSSVALSLWVSKPSNFAHTLMTMVATGVLILVLLVGVLVGLSILDKCCLRNPAQSNQSDQRTAWTSYCLREELAQSDKRTA
jgi:thiol:disulfide interchange protein